MTERWWMAVGVHAGTISTLPQWSDETRGAGLFASSIELQLAPA